MAWAPQAAMLWAFAYGVVRVWWAIGGTPPFGRLGIDLIAFKGWGAVILCIAAAGVAFALREAPWSWPLLAAGWAVCAALLVACPLLLLDAVGLLFPHSGVPLNPAAFLSRAGCLAGAILVGASAEGYRRRWRSACLFCGRADAPLRIAKPPRWAWWAAYGAVAGCLVRIAVQATIGFGGALRMFFVFEACFLLAGTLLPLALVHAWGRILPSWIPLLAGRRVPRWLLLGPAFAIAIGLTVYFGVSMVGLATAMLEGRSKLHVGPLPMTFFWVAMPAYWVWGFGMGIAALSYYRITRPPCRVCGRA